MNLFYFFWGGPRIRRNAGGQQSGGSAWKLNFPSAGVAVFSPVLPLRSDTGELAPWFPPCLSAVSKRTGSDVKANFKPLVWKNEQTTWIWGWASRWGGPAGKVTSESCGFKARASPPWVNQTCPLSALGDSALSLVFKPRRSCNNPIISRASPVIWGAARMSFLSFSIPVVLQNCCA